MKHIYFFQYNVPAENHINNKTDFYVSICAEWSGDYWGDKAPLVYTHPILLTKVELRTVRNWNLLLNDIELIGEKHFADIARQERINRAKAVLINEEMPVA